MRLRASAVVLAALSLLGNTLGSARSAGATQVKIFQTQSQAGFLAGKMEGVSVDAFGRMTLAPRAEKLAALSEPFLLSTAVHPDGWVAGTGNAGKVLRIDKKGTVTELFTAPEPEVFAVLADPDGTVWAGTSPRGKVYRIPVGKGGKPGKAEVWFDPGETYIWSLARAADGALLVGTGTQGKLFRVRDAGKGPGKGEILYDSDDTHVRSLEVLPGGDVLIGTAGEGLILRLDPKGQVRTLYDSAQPEVVGLTVAPDGTCYAAVIASEATQMDLTKDAAAAAVQGAAAKGGEATVTVTVSDDTAAAPGRKAGTGPRSEILSLSPAGVVESLWSFTDDTVYDLLWRPDGLWIATGLEGKLYRWSDGQMLLEKDVDERQIVGLLPGDAGPAFATTNAAALYRITAGTEKSGTYTSAALDTGQVSRFGTFRWRGEAPGRDALRFSFRSGVSAEPDRTWSPWTEPRTSEGKDGDEVSLSGLPRGRYVQWRAELRSVGSGSDASTAPQLDSVELSYRQENLKPKIDLLAALDPGQILVPATFNPSNQVYEPAHPNKDGIFTGPGAPADEDGRTKVLWKKGFRTLRWTSSDPNDDELVYDLSFRPADSPADWMKVTDELKDPYYSFDATVLPDGVYRFRLHASDRLANEPESALAAERVSDPVVIDQTPPVLGGVKRDGERLRVAVRDALSPLREAVYSVDAQEWKPAEVADGLLDGQSETLLIPAGVSTEASTKNKGGLVLLRVTDAAYNVTTFDLSHER
jgi:hypothetical protein